MNYLDELNKIRKRILIKKITVFLILIILCFFPILFIKGEAIDYIKYILIFGFVISLCSYWISKSICEKDIEKYKKIYAKNVTLNVLKDISGDVTYQHNDDLLPKDFSMVIEEAKIPTSNSYSIEDYFSVIYKNIKVEYCDIVLSYTPRNSEDNIHDVFKGKWLVLSFNKKFKSNIQIGPKIFNGKKNAQMLKGNHYKKINTKDNEFDKKFIVYADNEEEALNILSPNMIEKLKYLHNNTNGKILLFFIDNKMHIGIGDRENFFEPNIYKKINLAKETKKIENQIKLITNFIDYLID